MTKFATWTNPATGQIRIYVNNLPGQRGAKIWIEQQPADSFGDELNIRARADNMNRSELGNLVNDVERELTKMAGTRVKTWEQLLALVA